MPGRSPPRKEIETIMRRRNALRTALACLLLGIAGSTLGCIAAPVVPPIGLAYTALAEGRRREQARDLDGDVDPLPGLDRRRQRPRGRAERRDPRREARRLRVQERARRLPALHDRRLRGLAR